MASSIYPIPVTFSTSAITAGTDILTSNIVISPEQVAPGGGGILRIYFSIEFDSGTSTKIDVFGNNPQINKGALNADNNSVVESKGYYRFDIDVEANDLINFKTVTTDITKVQFFRAHLVVFGA